MKNAVTIFIFTILVTSFYWYVGQQVPQKITYPPKELEIRPDLTTEEMVKIGEEIVNGKGTCQSCHGLPGGRFPDLHQVGAVAGSRKPGMSDVDYLAESLYDPNKFIVPGFLKGMPTISKPPIALNDDEILTVIAYLQSQGGTPTVTMQTRHVHYGEAPAAAAGAKAAAAPPAAESLDGPGIFSKYACATCHSVDTPDRLVGPSLYDVGKRLSRAEIAESILEPDAKIAPGFPAGVMSATLKGGKFYDQVTIKNLNTLVDYLASLKGN